MEAADAQIPAGNKPEQDNQAVSIPTTGGTSTPMSSDLENQTVEAKPPTSPSRSISGIRWALVCLSLYISIFILLPLS